MIIPYVTDDTLNTLKSNIKTIKYDIDFSGQPNFEKICGDEGVILASKIKTEPIELIYKKEKGFNDLNNIKELYSKLELSESQASDERLWVGMAFDCFFDYMVKRWSINSEVDIMNHYFFAYSKQRSLMRHGLARLWWIGHMTHDSDRKNPYELTEFILEDSDYISSIFERNFSNNKIVLRAMMDALLESRKQGIKVNRDTVRKISQHLIILGGIYIIDVWSYEEIYNRVLAKLKES